MTLAELITAHKGDASYERLAKKATDAGHPITASMLHNLVSKPIKNIPRMDTLSAISVALGVSTRTVLDASAETLGLTQPDDDLTDVTSRSQVEALLSVVRHRDPDELEHLNRVVRAVASALDAGRSNPGTSPNDDKG